MANKMVASKEKRKQTYILYHFVYTLFMTYTTKLGISDTNALNNHFIYKKHDWNRD